MLNCYQSSRRIHTATKDSLLGCSPWSVCITNADMAVYPRPIQQWRLQSKRVIKINTIFRNISLARRQPRLVRYFPFLFIFRKIDKLHHLQVMMFRVPLIFLYVKTLRYVFMITCSSNFRERGQGPSPREEDIQHSNQALSNRKGC